MKASTFRIILLVIIAGLIGYMIGVNKINADWNNFKPELQITSKEPPPNLTNVDMTMFWTVLQKLETSYYDKTKIKPQDVVNGAITGMVQSLNDPYTVYLPPKQNQDFKQGLAGQFEGIGAELGMKDKQIVVVAPLDGSPSQKAGIRAGDEIMKVDNQSTLGWTLNQAIDKIRGPKGTAVTLSVVHKDQTNPTDIKIVRDTIQVKSVATWVKKIKDIDEINGKNFDDTTKNEKVAYIRLSQFGDNTNQEWLGLVNKLAMDIQHDTSIKGVVLDLRNNPGGYLTDAVFIASEFIGDGTVVMQEDAKGERVSLPVSRKGLLTDVPLVVLLNKGSASASEIVAGALRDHNRAKLIGDTSFGKGTIQQAEDLGGGAGLHITVAKWLTPNGTWVHMKGLTPDVQVSLDPKDPSHDSQLEKAIQTVLQ